MAEQTKTKERPPSLVERLVETGVKQLEKKIKDGVDSGIAGGQSPQEIMGEIVQLAQKQPQQQQQQQQQPNPQQIIQQLAQTKENIPGSQIGLPGTIANLLKGKGLQSPFTPRQQELGVEGAQARVKRSQQIEQSEATLLKTKIDTAVATNDEQAFQQLTGKSLFEVQKTKAAQDAKFKAQNAAAVKDIELGSKIKASKLVSKSNMETLGGVALDLAQVFADAIDEGGAGGLIQSTIAGAATKIGDLPEFLGGGKVGGKFKRSGALEGKRNELMIKMVPWMTQQALNPVGSVRFVESLAQALGVSIPSGATAPETAREQLKETLQTFLRFSRSAELLGQDFDSMFKGPDGKPLSPNDVPPEAIQSWAQGVMKASENINFSTKEQEGVTRFINTALSPLDKKIAERNKKDQEPREIQKIDSELADIDAQLKALGE